MPKLKKHIERVHKSIDARLGKGKGAVLLKRFENIDGNESPKETAKLSIDLINHLEKEIDKKNLSAILEECACWQKSPSAEKTFSELRKKHSDDVDYLKAVAHKKKAEYINGEIIAYFYRGKKNSCTCPLIKGGYDKPSSPAWCSCCLGFVRNIYKLVFPQKNCHVDIMKTFATGGDDCVFKIWWTDKKLS